VLPFAPLTAHDALVVNGRLKAGESVFVQGASSAVGLMALQIARAMGAGLISGSSSNTERRNRLAEFGATLVVDPADASWPDASRAADLLIAPY
jgi:NADPH:quinone reductase